MNPLFDYRDQIDQVAPQGATAVGFVPCNDQGEVLLVEPSGHFGGVSATFPKVSIRSAETSSAALTRCIEAKVGLRVESLFPVGGRWRTANSVTAFFAGLVEPGAGPQPGAKAKVAQARWCDFDAARQWLSNSANVESRDRDLAILGAIQGVCISPHRRQFLALHELHLVGFEGLRALAYMAPSGMYWRCEYWPVSCFGASNGAMIAQREMERFKDTLGDERLQFRYSSGDGQAPFGWQDAVFDSPLQLAEKVRERCGQLVFSGWGKDPEYAHWFEEMLKATAPHGVYWVFQDYHVLDEWVEGIRTPREIRIEPPPPGEASDER